jgi:signal transduction histidine kinase/DNA-binding response OmpR family regulator
MIRIGEGIVGQAAVNGKLIHLKGIPAENINVTFATGEAKPSDVLAIPIMDGYIIKGVIELATLGSYSPRDVEFLSACAPNIGIAISTAQSRLRLQELLEETQSQAEELKTQHSELENLNGELEVQAEKLQASEEELKVQQEELKQANQELEERSRLLEERNHMISERNTEIQQKADQLAESTRYKSEFLANMSHELRTPLNSILLLSRLISENNEKNLSADQVEYAKVIQSSGHGLLSLIDEILDLSKIEAGKMKVEYQSVSLKEIVHEMKSLFGPVAREKSIELRTVLSEDTPTVLETDKMRLEQILRNLLSNAIKFTAAGHVTLNIRPDKTNQGLVHFSVTDTGIGIPKEKQRIIFEAFQQADGSTRRKFGGTGLGLSISRELVKLLGGDLSVQSEVEQGSTFSFQIPVERTTQRPEPSIVRSRLQPALSEPVSVKARESRNEYISTEIPESIPDDRNSIQQGDKVILIVEDDVNFAKSLFDVTHRQGYKCIVAVRGDEGIQLAKQFLPLGILLDIQLPIMSGWDVMEELKSTHETRHIPVHIMSSHHVKSESLLKGAVDFINKPVAFDQVQEIFKKIEYVLTHHPKKVLIIEENARHAKALAYFLETFDINLEINQQVDQAIDSLKNKNIDCVILDMGIPDQRAYDTLEAVKRTNGLENLPIIIFTGKSLSQPEEMKIKQYADSIIVKTAHSYKRILDEVSLFLHLMEKNKKDDSSASAFHKLGALDDVLKDKNVLIADDDMRNIFSLTRALEKYQMNIIAAVDGKDALIKLKENPDVDIVLMDMMMPEMDGYESTAAIRMDPRFKNLPVIAVTAKAMMGDRAKCISAGASDYITKPVDIDQLLSLLRVWLYERM